MPNFSENSVKFAVTTKFTQTPRKTTVSGVSMTTSVVSLKRHYMNALPQIYLQHIWLVNLQTLNTRFSQFHCFRRVRHLGFVGQCRVVVTFLLLARRWHYLLRSVHPY